ncbi:MAG: hypothetical protein KAW41_06005 [Candidatus Diapherotrites archaeon]|nr:hypothetical protein [Candidatus Diapherotrites archaeon]
MIKEPRKQREKQLGDKVHDMLRKEKPPEETPPQQRFILHEVILRWLRKKKD